MSLLKKLKGLLFPAEAEPGQLPPWIDRLKPATYTSVTGLVIPFEYIDLSSYFTKKTAVFGNVNAPGVYVQDNGVGGFRFPMACIFSGANHDVQSATFLKSLLETGEGTLSHPVFGPLVVVPVGEIEHVSALVSAANQTTIMVEFFETTGLQIGSNPPFDSLLEAFEAAAAASFDEKLNVSDVADKKKFADGFVKKINGIENTLNAISTQLSRASDGMNDIADSITRTIDVTIGQPLALARQTQLLIGQPARIAAATRARLRGYANMARDIFGLNPTPTGYDYSAENAFHGDSLIASSAVSNAAVSSFNNDFVLKAEFLNAATELGALLDEFSTWNDDSYTNIGTGTPETQDTGDGWTELQEYVSAVQAELVTRALTATTEIRITLDRDRGNQELCFELYGTAKPDQLDFFASTNDFSGDEIFVIKEGREIVYYV